MYYFTKRFDGIVSSLITRATFINPNDYNRFVEIEALWDTGASHTKLSGYIIRELDLPFFREMEFQTLNGPYTSRTFNTNLRLPFTGRSIDFNIEVAEPAFMNAPFQAIIGMDVINCGDFSVTNFNNNTVMSFRHPSMHEIDYETNP